MLSAAEGNGYAAASWLEDDGDLAEPGRGACPRRAGAPAAPDRDRGAGARAAASTSAAATRPAAEADCAAAAVLIAPNWERAPEGRCLFVGRERLRRDGALAIRITGRGLAVEAARASGRPWSGIPPRDASDVRVARMGTRAHSGK